jgi:hypothetical protein
MAEMKTAKNQTQPTGERSLMKMEVEQKRLTTPITREKARVLIDRCMGRKDSTKNKKIQRVFLLLLD